MRLSNNRMVFCEKCAKASKIFCKKRFHKVEMQKQERCIRKKVKATVK
jgi:hypothetical protein